MKGFKFSSFLLIVMLFSSCMTVVRTQRTYPAELSLNNDTNRIIFINFFDYTVPQYIKDNQEEVYRVNVKSFAKGLAAGFTTDSLVKFNIADTLARKYTLNLMQDSSFTDSIKSLCKRFDAGMIIALDSINIWMHEEIVTDDDNSATSEYYLYSSNYISLYSSDGEIIDRSTAERSKFYKSRPAFFMGLVTFAPSIAKAANDVAGLSEGAGRNYASRFYPFSESVDLNLYTGRVFNESNNNIISGKTVLAIDPLRQLSGSANSRIAKKAGHNLSVVYQIMENRRLTDQIYTEFRKK